MKKYAVPLIFAIILAGFSSAFADWPSEIKIEASDGNFHNDFGHALYIDGNFCMVGAHSDNYLTGAVYVYHFDGSDWIEEQKLTASDGFPRNYFGYSVCLDGDICVVGTMARVDDGAAYVFRYNGVNWFEEQKLPLPAEARGFGNAVAVEKNSFGDIDYCIVGDPGVWANDTPKGAAFTYWYDSSSGSWQFGQKLVASDFENSNLFGMAVSIDGDYCVIGMPGDDVNAVDSGSAYIFKNGPTGWIQQQKLTPDGPRMNNERFGSSVSIDGNVCIIGARGSPGSSDITGSAYVYYFNGSNWTEVQELIAPDAQIDDQFGCSVSVFGDMCIIGASEDDNWIGSAYIYKIETGCWGPFLRFIKKLTASDGPHQYEFGKSVAINGNNIIVGQPATSFSGAIGSAYIYDLTCPSADLTGDCYVDFKDFSTMAGQWLDGIKPLDVIP